MAISPSRWSWVYLNRPSSNAVAIGCIQYPVFLSLYRARIAFLPQDDFGDLPGAEGLLGLSQAHQMQDVLCQPSRELASVGIGLLTAIVGRKHCGGEDPDPPEMLIGVAPGQRIVIF